MKMLFSVLLGFMGAVCSQAEVRVFVTDTNGVAWLGYECTSGESVRAFALDVSVDRGQIIGISDFFRGPGTASATGYGIFPSSFRDHLASAGVTNINWSDSAYSPVANPADSSTGTLSGLGTAGVTLEFGALWDPGTPAAIPPSSGVLCSFTLSQPAIISVAANVLRGGVVSTSPLPITLNLKGGIVGPAILNTTIQDGTTQILFKGGELQTAPGINGPWTGTGELSGSYQEPFDPGQARFFRVRTP
jgi:hypothetical protein